MSASLHGLMQDDFPLTLHHIRRRMRACSPEAQVVSVVEPGDGLRQGDRLQPLAHAVDHVQLVHGEPGYARALQEEICQ